jgi:hypothetical protein
MKKILYILAVVAVFAACKGKSDNDLNANKEIISLTDSTFYNSNYLSDTGAVSNPEDFTGGAVVSGKATVPARTTPARRSSGGSYSNSGTSSSGSSNSGSGTTATTRKKGMSKAAQGAIIGGVGGAVAGAVIGKGKGAVIGGVVGAAGGYIIGRNKDKRDGRVQ